MAMTGYDNLPHSHALNDPGHTGANYIGDGSVGIAPKLMTPVERIARTLNEARELSSRITGIVDNLVGSRPEAESKGERITGGGGGILTSLAANAEDTISELRRANDELSRLSKVLGLGL